MLLLFFGRCANLVLTFIGIVGEMTYICYILNVGNFVIEITKISEFEY